MKSENAVHAAFAIPELASPLFAYLTPHDLTQCVRVCKWWLHHAEPVLWKNFSPGEYYSSRLPPEGIAGLRRNLPHIRTIELTVKDFGVLQELARGMFQSPQSSDSTAVTGTNLRRLKIEDSYPPDHWEVLRDGYLALVSTIGKLLNHNLRLTHLTMPFPDMGTEGPVLAAISNLRNLQYLSIDNSKLWAISPRTILLIFRACLSLPKLTGLAIACSAIQKMHDKTMAKTDVDVDTIIKEATVARFSQTPMPGKIKALQLPIWPGHKPDPLVLPLLKSGLLDLESCAMLWFAGFKRLTVLEQTVREYCPNLKHLRCPDFVQLDNNCVYLCAFIRGCTGLRSFAANGVCDNPRPTSWSSHEARHVVFNLVTRHGDTLEDLELKGCSELQVQSADQQSFLTRCKQLKRYYGTFRSRDSNAGFNGEDVLKEDWVCAELQELRITLARGGDGSQSAAKWFYGQIGRLEKLEQLALDVHQGEVTAAELSHEWDLSLSRGWLGELTGLKRLWSLSLEANFSSGMGQAEVEFMHEHWPLLSEINIVAKDVWQLRTQAHWQWLRSKRPYLRFNTQEYQHPQLRMQM
ncbi:hypothetical protein BGZ72_011140 [Mortierella alpina]|nr:hypothetical protein BGZ72_011140 [Mortierella alpina]